MCLLLLDVTPLTLGVETAFGTMTPVIKRNTTIPTRKSCLFTTFCDNQSNMLISIYEGERSRVKDNHLIGQLLLEGIVQVPKGVPRIEVTFDLDANGMLSVCACDKVTGKKNSVKITDKAKLKATDIATMVTNAEENKEEDQLWGLRLNEMIQLMDLAWRMKSLVNDKVVRARISDDYRRNIIKTCEELMAWLGTQHDTITIVEVKRRQCLFNDVCCGIMLLLEYDKAVMDIYRRMENFSELPMISQDKCIKSIQ